MSEPKGVTVNWNTAYQRFKATPRYTSLFIINNDIHFANGSFDRMAAVLREVGGPAVVGPMTTRKGLGLSHKRGRLQCVEKEFPQVCWPVQLTAPHPKHLQGDSVVSCAMAVHSTLLGSVSVADAMQVPAEYIERLPATTAVLQHYVTTRSSDAYVRAKWLLGACVCVCVPAHVVVRRVRGPACEHKAG